MLKVVKFGGSSLADGSQFAKVKEIIEQDEARKVVVVSAPGKRNADDNKITDLLYLCRAHIKYDVGWESIFELIEERYRSIREECGLSLDLEAEFAEIRKHLVKGVTKDYIASRGEYLNAKLMAEYLGYAFVDAADWMHFGYNGKVDEAKTEESLKELYDVYGKIVIPGFYGTLPNGEIKVFSRGGSDVTGAIAAASLNADVYENWTDVSGIKMVDPKIVPKPKTIPLVTYAELRELSFMGASVLHEDTVMPVRQKDIPLNIRNTNDPEAPGTLIKETFPTDSEEGSNRFITGITGKKDFSIIDIRKLDMGEGLQLLRKTLKICDRYEVSVAQIPGAADGFSLVVPTAELNQRRYDFLSEIQEELEPDELTVTDGISRIAIVGRQMAYTTGISGKLFGALGANKINIRTIEQSADEINITVGVFTEDFERAIKILYESFAV